MRYGSLLSLLIVVALIAYLFAKYNGPVLEKGRDAKDQVQPISGKTADGIPAEKSVTVEGEMVGGQLRSLKVTGVTPGGYFEQYYGLKVGDQVLQTANGIDVSTLGDPKVAEAQLWSVQRQPITILRNGQRRTLNASDGTLSTGGGTSTSQQPAAPSSPGGNSVPAPSGGSGIPGLPDSIQVPHH